MVLNKFLLCYMGSKSIFRKIASQNSMTENRLVRFPWINIVYKSHSEGKKPTGFNLLYFHEFLSDLLHTYRLNRWHLGNFLGTQKFRILTHKRNIFTKMWIFNLSKMAIFGGVMSKKSLGKIGVMDMFYIMDSCQNWLYPTFSNIFSPISAESDDLSENQKKIFFFKKKRDFFGWKSALKGSDLVQ